MFKISEFARFSRVTVKMLRHYDEIGLLKPAYVDPGTQYRYYTTDQLPRLNRIIALKDLGFSLQQIGLILDESLSQEELRGLMKIQRAETRQKLQEAQIQLAEMETRLADLEAQAHMPPYEIILRSIRPVLVASIHTGENEFGGSVSELFEALEAYIARHQARASQPPFLIYNAAEAGLPGMEVAIPIIRKIPAGEGITVRRLPGYEQVACVVHTGRYETLGEAYTALFTWIERQPYQPIGPVREVYLRFGADQKNYILPDAYLAYHTAEFVTEIQVPVSGLEESLKE